MPEAYHWHKFTSNRTSNISPGEKQLGERIWNSWTGICFRRYQCKEEDSKCTNLSVGSLPGISTNKSWSQMIRRKLSLYSWIVDWQTPENLLKYSATYKCTRNQHVNLKVWSTCVNGSWRTIYEMQTTWINQTDIFIINWVSDHCMPQRKSFKVNQNYMAIWDCQRIVKIRSA